MPRGDWPAAPVIYQIYPRSFLDTTGNGVGDLNGITERLDHVAALGVDGIWLSPFFPSPWDDGGYDISDYWTIHPKLGTEADFDRLVTRAHSLGLRVMIDQVLNHTSDQHPWFRAACAGDDAMAERYLFCDPKPDGTPPNNWLSQFGIPGWSWCHKRRQYYFHQFLATQPSVNLRHPAVQDDHRAQMRHWRDRGVDGFRFDAVTSYLWDESLADNPPASREVQERVAGETFMPYTYQDHVYDMLPGDGATYAEKLREWAGDDAYLLGEITSGNASLRLAMDFTGPDRLDACYTTDLPETAGAPETIARVVDETDLQRLGGWLSSHDQPRHTEGAPEKARVQAALMAF
ncbi:MAG: alpha-amylase family glycosyl hydrolase, partial [Shimia sp.]